MPLSLNFPQLDFVKPSSGFHPVTWERVKMNGRESNWQFDSRPLKIRNQPDFLGCRRCATYHWKALDEAYNFASDRIAMEVWTRSYVPSKSRESGLMEFRDFHLGVPGQNGHLDVVPVEWRRVYYKGEGGGFPQVQAVVSLVCSGCPWLILAPKVLQLCTNHLVLVCASPCEWIELVTSS